MITKLKEVSSLYSQPDKNGNRKLIKKDVITALYIHPQEIAYVGEIYNSRGNVLKNMCQIKIDGDFKVLKHTAEEIARLKDPQFKTIGFKTKK